MVADRQWDTPMVWIGGLGLLALLLVILTYAVVESGANYQPEQINRFVQEQDQAQ